MHKVSVGIALGMLSISGTSIPADKSSPYTQALQDTCYQTFGPYERIQVSCENVNSILDIVPAPIRKEVFHQDKIQYEIYYDKNGTPIIMVEKPETLEI